MCGRFAFYSPAEATAALFRARGSFDIGPRYNIAPTQYVAAVREDQDGQRELVALRWGLVPFWAKDPAIGNRMINARAETVAEKPAYRAAFRRRRCVVLADGFYEWQRGEGAKTPFYISLANGEPCGLAALWEQWKDRETDETLQTTTIITMQANDFMAPLHHRMPLVLEAASANEWLSGTMDLEDDVEVPALQAWPVDRRVNNARNEGEDLVEAVGDILR